MVCAKCGLNPRLSYHPYCRECKNQHAREHPQKYIPHPLPNKTWEERFWEKVRKTDGCFFWIGSVNQRGYAGFKDGNIVIDPGLFLYRKLHGTIPDGFVLSRTCRISSCVNPAHLVAVERKLPLDDFKKRFQEQVDTNGPIPAHKPHVGPCSIWTGPMSPVGYGRFYFAGRDRFAHIAAWMMWCGEIPNKKVVMHLCDNMACVRLEHLELGTQAQNVEAMLLANRDKHPRGEAAGKAKLTEEKVRLIRYLYNPITRNLIRLARIFKVTSSSLSAIVTYRSWRHVE